MASERAKDSYLSEVCHQSATIPGIFEDKRTLLVDGPEKGQFNLINSGDESHLFRLPAFIGADNADLALSNCCIIPAFIRIRRNLNLLHHFQITWAD